jgi:DUF1009 family protein
MIALISGKGDYPKEITSSLKNQKINFIKLNLYQKDKYNVSIGEIGKIIKILKTNNVKEVIFAGKVERPNLRKIKLDLKAISYLPLLKKAYLKGDGNLLNLVAKILRDENIKIIESHKYCKNLILNNTPTRTKPSKVDIHDFKKGKKILNLLSEFDNAQGIIIDEGYILAIEAAEGTDEIVKRIKNINYKKKKPLSGSLIKLTKTNQNLKYDLPTIGYTTISLCIKSNLKGIFLEKNKNIFLNQKKSIDLANKNNFFITAI